MCTLDNIDFAILNELTGNARKTLKALSAQINLSAPAVATRIRKLEDASAILGYRAVLDYEKLGYEITAMIHLALPQEKQDAFRAHIRKRPQVITCDHITGSYSILMRVVFHDRRELSAFVHDIGRFGKTQVQVVLDSMQEPQACADKNITLHTYSHRAKSREA